MVKGEIQVTVTDGRAATTTFVLTTSDHADGSCSTRYYAELETAVCQAFDIQPPLVLAYVDEDGDIVVVDSERELADLINSHIASGEEVINLHIHKETNGDDFEIIHGSSEDDFKLVQLPIMADKSPSGLVSESYSTDQGPKEEIPGPMAPFCPKTDGASEDDINLVELETFEAESQSELAESLLIQRDDQEVILEPMAASVPDPIVEASKEALDTCCDVTGLVTDHTIDTTKQTPKAHAAEPSAENETLAPNSAPQQHQIEETLFQHPGATIHHQHLAEHLKLHLSQSRDQTGHIHSNDQFNHLCQHHHHHVHHRHPHHHHHHHIRIQPDHPSPGAAVPPATVPPPPPPPPTVSDGTIGNDIQEATARHLLHHLNAHHLHNVSHQHHRYHHRYHRPPPSLSSSTPEWNIPAPVSASTSAPASVRATPQRPSASLPTAASSTAPAAAARISDRVTSSRPVSSDILPWRDVVCDHCGASNFSGSRFKCNHEDCVDYDLCSTCFDNASTFHARDHLFHMLTNENQLHSQIWCDNCGRSSLVGSRYKCVDCPDFDLCQKCIRHVKDIHTPGHWFNRYDKASSRLLRVPGTIPNHEADILPQQSDTHSAPEQPIPPLDNGLNGCLRERERDSYTSNIHLVLPGSYPAQSSTLSASVVTSSLSFSPSETTLPIPSPGVNEQNQDTSFPEQQAFLVEMGFNNLSLNERLLRRFSGNVDKAAEELLGRGG